MQKIWISIILFSIILFSTNCDDKKNCLTLEKGANPYLVNVNFNNKNSDFSFCYSGISLENSKAMQCYFIKDLRNATVNPKKNKVKSISSNKVQQNNFYSMKNLFGSSLENTKQGILVRRKDKINLCIKNKRSNVINSKCNSIQLSKKLKNILSLIFQNKKEIKVFLNDVLLGLIIDSNQKDQYQKWQRKLIVSIKKNKQFTSQYETLLPSTGYEYDKGYFRNNRVFINDCAAGPSCVLLKQTQNRNKFKKFLADGYNLQESVLYHDKVLLMSFDAKTLIVYNDATQKIESSKSFKNKENSEATLIRVENQYLIFYEENQAGKVDSIDSFSPFHKTNLLNIKQCSH